MAIFNVDSVISIEEELAHCYHHRRMGLEPIEKTRSIRTEKKAIYKENSAIYLSRTAVFRNRQLVGEKVGHITMLPEESIKINTAYDLWLSEKVLLEWLPGGNQAPSTQSSRSFPLIRPRMGEDSEMDRSSC
jgi:CMP-N-acetylneuraminic acid synthetase